MITDKQADPNAPSRMIATTDHPHHHFQYIAMPLNSESLSAGTRQINLIYKLQVAAVLPLEG